MSIEAKLDALTAAINGLTAAVQGAQPAAADKVIAATINTKTAPAATKPEGEKPTPAVSAKALTYDDVKVPFLALVKKNRDQALAVLKPFGLDSLKPAKPEQFAAILAALNSALAA